MSRLLPVFAFP